MKRLTIALMLVGALALPLSRIRSPIGEPQ